MRWKRLQVETEDRYQAAATPSCQGWMAGLRLADLYLQRVGFCASKDISDYYLRSDLLRKCVELSAAGLLLCVCVCVELEVVVQVR
jgi:hypothetical protein